MSEYEKVVNKICQKNFPESKVKFCRDVSGLINKTFFVNLKNLNQEIVVHICHNPKFEDGFKNEPFIIQHLSSNSDIPVPKIITANMSKDTVPFPYYISWREEGYNPDSRFKYLPTRRKKKLLKQVGRKLGALHKNNNYDSPGFLNATNQEIYVKENEWVETVMRIAERYLEGLNDGRFEEQQTRIRKTLENNINTIQTEFQPCLLHHDMRPANILVREGDLKSIIDWERSLSGHREFDLFETERNFIDLEFKTPKIREQMKESFYEGYTEVIDLNTNYKKRRRYYRLIYLIEKLWFFPKWAAEFETKEYERTAKELKKEADRKIKAVESQSI